VTRSALLWLALGLTLAIGQDLDVVKSEPNPEKRSDKALALAQRQMETASKAYSEGQIQTAFDAADGVLASIQLSVKSLEESGKNPHGSKYYKRAELRTRELARRLSDFSDSASYEDRARFQKIRDRVLSIHDGLLDLILVRKKK
jgi:hypothetical protein